MSNTGVANIKITSFQLENSLSREVTPLRQIGQSGTEVAQPMQSMWPHGTSACVATVSWQTTHRVSMAGSLLWSTSLANSLPGETTNAATYRYPETIVAVSP